MKAILLNGFGGPDVLELGETEAPIADAGKVLIRADYTFVYPLAKAGGGNEVARAVVRRIVEVEALDPAKYQATEGRIWVSDVDGEISNDDCRRGDGAIRPQFQGELMPGPESSGKEVDPYDRSRGLNGTQEDCGTVSRT